MIQTLPLSGISGPGFCHDCNAVATTRRIDDGRFIEVCEACTDLYDDSFVNGTTAAATRADGIRIDASGHLIHEGVEYTIDGPDWIQSELTYRPTREDMRTPGVRATCQAHGCGLFLHRPGCRMHGGMFGR